MQNVNVAVGWMVFLGLVCSQASAQQIPEKARKDLRTIFKVRSWRSAPRCRTTSS